MAQRDTVVGRPSPVVSSLPGVPEGSHPSGGPAVTPPGLAGAPVGASGAVWERRDFGVPAGNHPPAFAAAASEGRTVVAVGTRSTSVSTGEALLWHSPDAGRTWREGRTDRPRTGQDALLAVDAVVHRGGEFVALGVLGTGPTGATDPHPSAVLTSADGARWRTRRTTGLDGQPAALAVARDGALVAVGVANSRAAVWRSRDGVAWTRVQGPNVRGRFDAVAPVGDVVVAVGSGDGTLLALVDGTAWRLVRAPVTGPTRTRALAARTRDVMLVTVACSDGNVCRQGGWSSSDGRQWRPVELPAFAGDSVLLVPAGDVVHLLADRMLFHRDPAGSWTSPGPAPLEHGQVLVATSIGVCVVGAGARDDLIGPAAACLRDA